MADNHIPGSGMTGPVPAPGNIKPIDVILKMAKTKIDRMIAMGTGSHETGVGLEQHNVLGDARAAGNSYKNSGNKTTANFEDPDASGLDDDLTPPPDTPINLSNPSSRPPSARDETIVVDTNLDRPNSSSPQAQSDGEDANVDVDADLDVDELEEEGPILPASALSKRKRASLYEDSVDEITDIAADSPPMDLRTWPPVRIPKPVKEGVKGVTLGYWRDSEPEDPDEKHAVMGFIDVRDRLRTRLQRTNRAGRLIINKYPIPPGPGGSWVTFDKVAFDPHLVNLNHFQVKEYVKIRVEMQKDESPEQKTLLDQAAVKEAIRRLEANPPPETALPVAIAYGPQIPDHVQLPARPDAKKRRLAASLTGTLQSPTATFPAVTVDSIPGTRPTRILLGYWKDSTEERIEDKHAVFGILGANDMFRVKLVRETRDGRHVDGNFPSGAGALWIHWDKVEFEPHLKGLARAEIKEYCRVRQRQLDERELPEERSTNQVKAAQEAQQRVADNLIKKDHYAGPAQLLPMRDVESSVHMNGNGSGYDGSPEPSYQNGLQPRQHGTRGRQTVADMDYHPANPPPSAVAMERTHSLARREVERFEANQQRADLRAASAAPNKSVFQDNMSRLNRVWAAQEASRLRASGGDDAKIYLGVKYERKQNGPFQGKLVSQGTIISIDGEDYVEYRVLTKPTFF